MHAHSAPGGRSAHDPKWHPTDYLRILYKRRWVAIPAFLVVLLSGALSSMRTVPVFEARTQLLIEKESRRATSIDIVLQDRESYYDDDFYPTQHRLIQSRTLALRTVEALERLGVRERVPEPPLALGLGDLVRAARRAVASLFGAAPPPVATRPADETTAQAAKIEGFLGSLQVVPVRSSRLVDLTFRSPDPEYATRAVNQLAEEYKRQSLELRSLATDEANAFLSAQLEEQRRRVEESEGRLQAFRENRNALAVDDRQNIVLQRLTDLNAQVTRARTTRLEKEGVYTTLRDMQARGAALDSFPAIMTNAFIQNLKNEVIQLETEQAQLVAAGFGASYPGMQAVTGRLTAARERLQTEIEKVVESVRAEFLSARAAEEQLTQALEAQKRESLGVDRTALEYAAMEREAAGNRQLYDNLLARANETGVSREFTGSNIQVVDAAEVPAYPVLPDVRRDLLFAGLGGLLLALALAIGFEFFDNRIKSPEEIKAHLGLPCLGMVPMIAGREHTGETPMLTAETPASFAEAIRSVRTAVLFSSAEEGARAIVITSAGPSEGKTLISSSLAVALAQTGQRTIIVDADMRRPRIHEVLGRSQEPGLSNVLVGEAAMGDGVRATEVEHLSVLAAGHIPPNPAELLGSKKFQDLIQNLKTRFDWVLIDAPPVMPVTDASVLAHSTNGVLFVVGAEMTPRQTASAAVEQLRSSGAGFIGVVLNRVNLHRHGYYYSPYYKKEYAKYYQRSPRQV